MKADWTERLRHKLEGHKQTPPAGLWEGISEQMGLPKEPVRRTIFMGRWRWVAAAAIVASIGFLVFHDWNKDKLPDNQIAHIEREKHTTPRIDKVTPIEEPKEVLLAKVDKPYKERRVKESVPAGIVNVAEATTDTLLPQPTEQREQSQTCLNYAESLERKTIGQPEDEVVVQEEKQQLTATHQQQPDLVTEHPLTQTQSSVSHTSRSQRWSLGVEASGGLLAAQTFQREGRLYYANAYPFYGAPGKTEANVVPYTITDYVSKHYLPVRFGISLQYQLTSRLSLLSGVNYTYLYSRFSISLYDNLVTDQRLHYLGVPLGVKCQLWSNRHFQVYVSGHAMLEKCLNERPWQWSAFAAAGAEYLPTHQFGLYLQPSLGYYFKDGTSLQHYYKKHPLAPSIEFGLRLHLEKGK